MNRALEHSRHSDSLVGWRSVGLGACCHVHGGWCGCVFGAALCAGFPCEYVVWVESKFKVFVFRGVVLKAG